MRILSNMNKSGKLGDQYKQVIKRQDGNIISKVEEILL